ncbi:MAG: hypothetical protein ACFCVD_12165 [Nodosilinea sp.]
MTTCYWPIHKFGDSNQDNSKGGVAARFSNFWHELLAQLEVSEEPKVWQTRNNAGQLTWNAYDATTDQAIYHVSDADLRTWLEERHYRDQAIAHERQMQLRVTWAA